MLRFRYLAVLMVLMLAIPAITFAQEAQPQPQDQQKAQPAEQPAQPAQPEQQPQVGEAQTPTAQRPALEAPYYPLSEIANKPVTDMQGGQVGTLKDAFVSTSGLITHWIVSVQNMPNLSAGDYVVPVYAVQVGLNGITLNLPDQPSGQNLVKAQGAKAAGVVAMDSIRATQLMTFNLVNDQGQNIGTIQDVVANLETHEITYAAVDLGGVLGAGQKMFAVPFSDLWYNLNRNTITLYNVNTQALQQNPGIDPQNWPEQANPDWNKVR